MLLLLLLPLPLPLPLLLLLPMPTVECLALLTAAQQPECFDTFRWSSAMTEPNVASSDAANIGIDIARDGDEYVINGQKWWITGAGSLHCKIMILMGKTDTSKPKCDTAQIHASLAVFLSLHM